MSAVEDEAEPEIQSGRPGNGKTGRMSLPREIVFVAIISSAQFLTQAGLAQAVMPLHIIGESFGDLQPAELSWFVAAYSLTVGTFILVAGRAGDILGHKRLFIFGYSWYSLWSLIAGLSGFARSHIFFDVCRAMQGIGPAALMPSSLALLGHAYPKGPRKDMAFSIFGATAPGGFVVGAVFSSLLSQFAWWPWAYWCMALTCALFAAAATIVIPDQEGTDTPFDYTGAALGVSGLVLFNVAWNQAPVVGWTYVFAFLVLGLVLLAAFFVVERRTSHPLLPPVSVETSLILGCVALGWSSFGIWLYYSIQFLELLRGQSPLLTSAQSVPTMLSGLCAALATGYLLSRVRTAWIMTTAMIMFCVGNVLLATAPVEQTYWLQTFLSFVLTPWGMDMSFPAGTVILSNLLPKEHQGIAASLVATVVNYSISIGLGIAGTVEVHENGGGEDLLGGFRGAWYAAIGLSGCGVLLSLWAVFRST